SEIKALLAFPGMAAAADDEAVLGFLLHGNCDYGERTTFRDVKALPAAHYLTLDLDRQGFTGRRHWQLQPQPARQASEGECINRLRELLVKTTADHLVSDVRVGSCLSGGLDSSVLVGLAGKIRREQPAEAAALGDQFHTFTSCYPYREIDERHYALSAA